MPVVALAFVVVKSCQCVGKSTQLSYGFPNQVSVEFWRGVAFPEVSQIASISPLKHEVSIFASCDSGNSLDNMLVFETCNVGQSVCLYLEILLHLLLQLFVVISCENLLYSDMGRGTVCLDVVSGEIKTQSVGSFPYPRPEQFLVALVNLDLVDLTEPSFFGNDIFPNKRQNGIGMESMVKLFS